MKKTFIAVAVLGALSTFALADSSVTLYGKIDVGPAVAKTKGSSAKASLDSGNYYGSRWGIRGVEDLGGGNNVGFQLEQGISADTGKGNDRQFHRISRLYVNGGWGEVGFGRWGALSSGTGPYDMIGGAIWFGDGSTSFGATNAWDTIASNPGRMDNSIVYVSPNFGGFTFKAMYSNKEDGSGTDDSANKWSKNNHYYGIGAKYAGGGLTSVLVFEVRDRDGLSGGASFGDPATGTRDYALTNNVDKPIYNLNFALGYDFGMIVPQFGYTWTKQEDVGSQHVFGLSAYSPIGAGRLTYGARYLFGSYDGQTKASAKSKLGDDKYRLLTLNVLYEYFLSKRTEVYGYAGWTKGSKAWSDTGRVTNYSGGSSWINTNGYAVQLGIVHSF